MVIPASQGTAINVAAGGGFEPPITGSKPVAVTAWLPGYVLLVLSDEACTRGMSQGGFYARLFHRHGGSIVSH